MSDRGFIRATLTSTLPKAKRGRGRPPHLDDPPVALNTTIPESVDLLLRVLSAQTGRPRSELLTEAIRAQAKRLSKKKPRF